MEVPVTEPTPLLILSDVAPDTVQLRVLLCPEVIVAGVAVKLEMLGGKGCALMVTVASPNLAGSATLVARSVAVPGVEGAV